MLHILTNIHWSLRPNHIVSLQTIPFVSFINVMHSSIPKTSNYLTLENALLFVTLHMCAHMRAYLTLGVYVLEALWWELTAGGKQWSWETDLLLLKVYLPTQSQRLVVPGRTTPMFQFSRMVFLTWFTLRPPSPKHTPPHSFPAHSWNFYLQIEAKEKEESQQSKSAETTFKKKKEK